MEYDVINENNVDELVKKVRAYIVGRKNMDLKEVKEFLDLAKEMKPNVKIGVEMIMSYAEELKPILDGLTKYMRSNTIEGIAFYENNGCSRDEAVWLVVSQNRSLQEALKRVELKK